MKRSFQSLPWFAVVGLMMVFLFVAAPLSAETVTNAATAKPGPTEESLVQKELLQAYIHLQEQLHEAKLAIESNRLEAQSTARTQAAEITKKLTDIQNALDTNQQQQKEELRRSNQTLLWVAVVFGIAGMGAMVFTAFFQWRTVNQVSALAPLRAQLTAGGTAGLLEAGNVPSGAVELSNQRLMSVIERLERRVLELEHSTTVIEHEAGSTNGADGAKDGSSAPTARIANLLVQGQSLLNEEQPERALECFDEILKLDENHPEALVKKGAALEHLKQDEQALQCYDRAIKADDKLTIAYLYKGGVFNRLERYNEALECYEQALRVQGGRES
jgi:tetratricopeptide (TPR) repeat protein